MKLKGLKFKNILNALKKNISFILLVLILIIVTVVSIKPGKYILSNDNYSPELNPALSVSRYLQSPAWRGYRVLGFASDSEQADIFRSGIFSIFNTFMPTWLVNQLFYFVSMAIGSLSIASLIKLLLKDSKLKKYSNYGYLFGGILYFTTLWTMWLFYQNMAPYIVNFGFLPLLFLSIYKYSKEDSWKNLIFIFLSSLLFTATSIISTLFLVDFLFIVLFIIFVHFSSKYGRKREWKNIFITLGVLIVTQLFWILPFLHYTFTTSSDVVSSYVNRTITSTVIDQETSSQSLANSARFYNRTLFEQDDGKYVFPMADLFVGYDFYKVLGLLPAILSLIGLVFAIVRKNFKLLFWFVIGIASLFLMKVLNPPLGSVFEWMQENILLFRQVFRWPFSKLGQVYLMCLVVLSTFGVVYLIKFFSSFISKRSFKNIFIVVSFFVFCIIQLAYSEYIFRGQIFADRAVVQLPSEYYELKSYLEENDSTGRIYYAPPSNDNYFREYDWGFWGSQFISYIIPNPVMDMSLAVGSKEGEEALLDITNAVRAQNSEEFLSLMQKYDVKYILYDQSINLSGYMFDLERHSLESLFSNYEKVWSKDTLSLFKVPQKAESRYIESLSPINGQDVFIKDVPKYPILSPLDMQLQNAHLQDGELVGEFEYKGFSTYMSLNLSEESIAELPTEISYSNGSLFVYPSFPYIEGDVVQRPYLAYVTNADYFVVNNTVLSKSDTAIGVTIDNKFGQEMNVYGVSDKEFESIDMISLLLQAKGNDCSGGSVVESTLVTPQELASGIEIKGNTDLPCIYTSIPLDSDKRNVVRVKINWENDKDNYAGYCVYSDVRKRCLNNEKFFSSNALFGDIDILIDTVIEKNEKISLILYANNIHKGAQSNVLFRKVIIEATSLEDKLELTSSSQSWKVEDIFLDDGNTYTIHIPVISGNNGYVYDGDNLPYVLWQPNKGDSQTRVFEVSVNKGMYQKVVDDYINQTANLFETNPNTRYLIYWKGKNISNIPSSICLIYDKENKCWYQDIFYALSDSTHMDIIESDNTQKLLNVIYGSSSYTLTTENVLSEFVFMQYPSAWSNLIYTQNNKREYTEYEMKNIFNSPHSTYYKAKKEEVKDNENVLVSIPQAHDSGWVAFARNGSSIRILGKDTRVSINGWKQGWDISNINFDSILVIYWPNLLSYFGYAVILLLGVYLFVNFLSKNDERK